MKQQDDFELKRALDALPREIEPPAEAWSGVRARIVAAGKPRRRGFAWPESFEPRAIRIAAGIGVIGIGLAALAAQTRAGAQWYVSEMVGNRIVRQARPVATGETFVTGNGTTIRLRRDPALTPFGSRADLPVPLAVLRIGSIGRVELAPRTEVRQLDARLSRHRLALIRGMIHAKIDAPPRLFIVETPSGTAVDLGCEYTMHVDSLGNTVLHVWVGWVEFDHGARESLVPAGFKMFARPGHAGVPVRETASRQVLWAALALHDAVTGARADSAVAVLRAYATRGDAVTLWHALQVTEGANRAALYDALAWLAPPPEGVTRAGALAGDRIMLRLWWEALPGTLPITPTWTKRVWLLWLKAANWL